MSLKQLPDGRWLVDVEPVKGRRFRKTLKTKSEALRFEATCRSKVIENTAWSPQKKDVRKLDELIAAWFDLHGHDLRDGTRRLAKLHALCSRLSNPVAARLEAHAYSLDRRYRLESGTSQKTLNNELGYLKSVYNELGSLGYINYENPLKNVKPLRIVERELSFLTLDQIKELLNEIKVGCVNPHVEPIVKICLATGSRWSEAENLASRSLQNNVITFSGTKSGKVRAVPVPPNLSDYLKSHWLKYGQFTGSITSFRRALSRTSIKLPRGQAAHALRHTFASHFIMNGGNILTLQKILGHSSLVMTMRYAHLSPEHLQDAVRLSPLSFIDTLSTP